MTVNIKKNIKSNCSIADALVQLDIDTENLFSDIFEVILTYIKFDAATFYILNFDTNKLEKVKSFKQDVEIFSGLQIEAGDGLSGWCAETARTILISDRTKKKSYNPEADYASFISIPIIKQKTLYGVLNLGSFTKNRFSEKDAAAVEPAGPILSVMVAHYLLLKKYNEIKAAYIQSVEQLQNLNNQIIPNSTADMISEETAEVIHGINNSLSIILGNLQCLLIGENEFNQKSLSRLKRIEAAAKKVADSNIQILNLNSIVNKNMEKIAALKK